MKLYFRHKAIQFCQAFCLVFLITQSAALMAQKTPTEASAQPKEKKEGEEPCSQQWAAKVEIIEGQALYQASPNDDWQELQPTQVLCYGSSIKIVNLRAALRLSNNTLVRLNEGTSVSFLAPKKSFWMELKQGAAHFLSRSPQPMQIKTAFANAATEGTEFVISQSSSSSKQGQIAVFEGRIKAQTSAGQYTINPMQALNVGANKLNQATVIKLSDAMNWALYYPASFIDEQTWQTLDPIWSSEQNPQLKSSEQAIQLARVKLFFGQLETFEDLLKQAEPKANKPDNDSILLLQALHWLIQGEIDQAKLSLNKTSNQNSAEYYFVQSYLYQAQGKLEQALTEIEKAVSANKRALGASSNALSPNLSLLNRQAELQINTQAYNRARESLDLARLQVTDTSQTNVTSKPSELIKLKQHIEKQQQAQTLALSALLELAQLNYKQANEQLKQALQAYPQNAFVQAIYALNQARQGATDKAIQHLELAALLDPNNAQYRAYLGHLYKQQSRLNDALAQYQLQAELDPMDPSADANKAAVFANKNQTNAAIDKLQASTNKTSNARLYRSSSVLEQDKYTRQANLVPLQLKLENQAWAQSTATGLASNSEGFAAQNALVQAFANSDQAQVLRANAALKARISKGPSDSPLSLGSGQTQLFIPSWLTPSTLGSRELSPILANNGIQTNLASFAGSQEQKGYLWQTQIDSDHLTLVGGQYQSRHMGYAPNNDIFVKISELGLHFYLNEQMKLMAHTRSTEEDYGDILSAVDNSFYSMNLRKKNLIRDYELGLHYQISPSNRLILTTALNHSRYALEDIVSLPFGDIPVEDTRHSRRTNTEVLFVHHKHLGRWQMGLKQEQFWQQTDPPFEGLPADTIDETYSRWYSAWQSPKWIHQQVYFSLGQSRNENKRGLSAPEQDHNDWKLGWQWQPLSQLKLNAAHWSQMAERNPISGSLQDSTIFNIVSANKLSNYAIENTSHIKINWQGSKIFAHAFSEFSEQEGNAKTTVNDAPSFVDTLIAIKRRGLAIENLWGQNWSSHLRYEWAESEDKKIEYQFAAINQPLEILSQDLSVGLSRQFTSWMQISGDVKFINQELYLIDPETIFDDETGRILEASEIEQLNLKLTLDLPNKRGQFSFEGLNLSNQKGSLYQRSLADLNSALFPTRIPWAQRRTIVAKLNIRI